MPTARPAGLPARPDMSDGPSTVAPAYLPANFPLASDAEPDAPLDFELDLPEITDFPLDFVPETKLVFESESWPEALASLQPLLPPDAPVSAATELPLDAQPLAGHATLVPAGAVPNAPNLNFQIIQYARFAVPVALAEQPFVVIYAPGWPTWLAAQELRQRTKCPLVLHVETLAAGAESADTATSWPAELQRQVLRQADLVLTETHALASRLRRELGLPAHAVRVVPAADTAGIARALHRMHVEPAVS